jgi:hypothetical protein
MVKGRRKKYYVATVTHIDFSGMVKRVKVHFQKTMSAADEWVQFGSDRIATLYSKTCHPSNKKKDIKKPRDTPLEKTKSSTLPEGEGKAEKNSKRKDTGDAKREKKKSKESAASDGNNVLAKGKGDEETRGEVEGEANTKKRTAGEVHIAIVKKQKSHVRNKAGQKALLDASSEEPTERDKASETSTAIIHADNMKRQSQPDDTTIVPENGNGLDKCASSVPKHEPDPIQRPSKVPAVRVPVPILSAPIPEPDPIPRAVPVSDDYFTPDVPNPTARRVTTEKTFQASVETAEAPSSAQFSPVIQTIPRDANRLHNEVGGIPWSGPPNRGSVPLQHRQPDMTSFTREHSVPSPPDFSLAHRSGASGHATGIDNTRSPAVNQFARQGGMFGDFQPSVPRAPQPPPQGNEMAMMASLLLGRPPQIGQPNFAGFAEPSFQEIQAMLQQQQQQQPGGPMDASLLRRLQQLLGNSNPGFYRE